MRFVISMDPPNTSEYEFVPSCDCEIVKISARMDRKIQYIHVLFKYFDYYFEVDVYSNEVTLQDIIDKVRKELVEINKKIENGEL